MPNGTRHPQYYSKSSKPDTDWFEIIATIVGVLVVVGLIVGWVLIATGA